MTTTTTTTTTTTVPPLNHSSFNLEGPYGDWRDDLREQGYAIIKNAIDPERALEYQRKALDWLKSFNTALDLDDPSTWTRENLPVQSKVNTFNGYCVTHEKFMWDARMEPKILEAFAKIWGTDELLVSFDALNITLPNREDKPARRPWPHVDQSPMRRGLHCIQGVINLSHAGPEDGSLMVYPRSNQATEGFFDTETDPSTWEQRDIHNFTEKQIQWFEDHGMKPFKVLAEPGDLLVWDSRTVHWGGEPTVNSNTIRTVIYASYAPFELATEETLQLKKEAFESYRATTHWPHDHIVIRDGVVYLPDGTIDPRNRSRPLEVPEHTDRLLQLAGVKSYCELLTSILQANMKSFESRPPVDYPRKRASIACNFCRHRVQDIPAEILLRLTHLETLIEQQKDAITELSARVASSDHPGRSTPTIYSSQPKYDWDPSPQHIYDKSSFNLFSPENPYGHEYAFTIPPGHHTPPGSLFALDRIKNLIGDYPEDFFKQIEIKRPFNSIQVAGIPQAFEQIDRSRLHPQVTKPLITEFLNHVHPYFPVLEPQLLHMLFETFSTYTKVNSIQTSLYLVILALGKASSNPERILNIEAEKDLSGMEYFASAYHYLNSPSITSFTADHLLPLALFYGSLYLRHIGRPIQAWRMVRDASNSVQLMIPELRAMNTYEERASLYRTAWGCFILECGIEHLVDGLPFPGISEDSRNGHLVFLAICSIRKLLNRVQSALYTKSDQEKFHSSPPPQRAIDTPGSNPTPQKYSITSLKTISEELDRQLEDWFNSLPNPIRPTLGNTISADHPYDTYILTRYYATKHIICRPSLVIAAHTQGSTVLPEFVFANCKKCVDSCRKFVWAASLLMRQRTYANWHRMQAILAAIFTLSTAKTTPALEALVPDFDDLVKEAIQCIEPWAQYCETADIVVSMMKTIRQKNMPPPRLTSRINSIHGVRLAGEPSTWDIHIEYPADSPQGTVTSVAPSTKGDFESPLALPALTHPHIHLDKAFIHSAPEYAPFLPTAGTFQEALSSTTKAKQQFSYSDIIRRGEWLLAESVASGVTAMRAFVEVDHTVQLICLEAAIALKNQWKNSCDIQIVCFAQDPIFSSEYGEQNMGFLETALRKYSQIDVIGTTPYVESSPEAAKQNIEWAIDCALEMNKHVDFHLDYNLDSNKEALVWHVLQTLKQRSWTTHSTDKRVMLGHCTRLTLLTENEWAQLATEIHDNELPVSFVGLPTSDMYMASPPRTNADCKSPQDRPRGTLQVLEMIQKYNLNAVIGVNNVGNSFTPWGLPDPLSLACLGVGVYQAGSQADAELLYECVSTRARAAIGLSPSHSGLCVKQGCRLDLLLVHHRDDTGCGVSRPRTNVAEVVWTPPGKSNRDVVFGGRLKISPFSIADLGALYQF
ncbi:Phytanoyl-CoA dioxygenase [Penicillium cf. griseofulvum]|uniref:Phytanoyl-CoA dioxygenase n=1 Tax=Penicillium cf. griseofulvum TaxID=2972120 RepID=A0A9W9JNQ5_9EURO|nr:Phytanoyl-CoA dioxygenase [Penicillium cf. griseofulvum]KAJ5423683.1 Phytanoyl-CoA dioxygenase [Penicillium cf. griseofulvum]